MKKIYLLFIVLFSTSILFHTPSVFAQNNKFGIHIAVPSDEDLARAAKLVNSSGGSYGYVTIVIQQNNRDVNYWQQIFDKLRELQLIPIIRLATEPDGDNWRAPNASDAYEWATFLNKLNWVVKERYIILFNEPNHATEWGGKVNAIEYGRVAAEFAQALKQQSSDFVIMLAGLDLAAPDSEPKYADAYKFLQTSVSEMCRMIQVKGQKCVNFIDAISSHAYPNPGFVGGPYDTGRTSIKGYLYEIQWFEVLIGKSLPVFITETGWDSRRLSQDLVASYYALAFQNVWLPDDRIKAVTPFVLNYQGEPFLQFSFLNYGDASPYPKYYTLSLLPKVAGDPEIVDSGLILADLPAQVVEESQYNIPVVIKNTGQSIWQEGKYQVTITTDVSDFQISAQPVLLPKLKPFDKTTAIVHLTTGRASTIKKGTLLAVINNGDKVIGSTIPKATSMELRPSLLLKVTLVSKGMSTGDNFEVQIFDATEKLVYKKYPVKVTLGRAEVSGISNVIPGRKYRMVILKPYYLPRQIVKTLQVGGNEVVFESMIPLDFNQDGKLSISDVNGLVFTKNYKDLNFFQKISLLFP